MKPCSLLSCNRRTLALLKVLDEAKKLECAHSRELRLAIAAYDAVFHDAPRPNPPCLESPQ
jgi:hypothetical protein